MIGPSQRPLPDHKQPTQKTDFYDPGGRRAAVHPRLRSRGHRYLHTVHVPWVKISAHRTEIHAMYSIPISVHKNVKGISGLSQTWLWFVSWHTGYTQKNGAVSKVNKKFISHLTQAQPTPSAAATVQVSHALPAVRFSCLLRDRGAIFQDGVAAGKGFLCAPFWGVQICDYSAAWVSCTV